MICVMQEFELDSKGHSEILDVTSDVRGIVAKAGLTDGIATVFTPGATASVTTIEFESGAVADLRAAIERAAPQDLHYKHDARWGDGNGFSHVRSAILGPSMTVPVKDGSLVLGTWQQIVVVDHDNRPRKRRVVVQIIGNE